MRAYGRSRAAHVHTNVMRAKDRGRKLYQKISQIKQGDPEFFVRQARTPEAIAQQAYQSSHIAGVQVSLDQLLEEARRLLECRESPVGNRLPNHLDSD
jgi:hypothetical protein